MDFSSETPNAHFSENEDQNFKDQTRDALEDNRMTLKSMEMALECAKTPELIKGIEFQIKCLKSNISHLEGVQS